MPYAMIPDGYSIKKVTKLQKQAVSSKRRHDNMEALLANPNTPLVAGGAVLLAALPILSKLFFDSLELENIIISDEQKMKVQTGFTSLLFASPATGPILLTKKIWDTLTGERDEDVGSGGIGRQP
jgi:tyrosyl-tRNA synthetase